MLYLFAAIFGFGHGGFAASESPMVAKLFGLKAHGLILGVAVFGFTIGSSTGPVLIGYIFDVTGSYRIAFMVCAFVGIAGLVLSILLRPPRGIPRKTTTI